MVWGFIKKIMGRPAEIRRRQEEKEKQEKASALKELTDLVKSQNDIINSLLEKLSEFNVHPLNGDQPIVSSSNRPKLDEFFINPSTDIVVKDSNISDKKEDDKTISDNLDDAAKKLKDILGKRKN